MTIDNSAQSGCNIIWRRLSLICWWTWLVRDLVYKLNRRFISHIFVKGCNIVRFSHLDISFPIRRISLSKLYGIYNCLGSLFLQSCCLIWISIRVYRLFLPNSIMETLKWSSSSLSFLMLCIDWLQPFTLARYEFSVMWVVSWAKTLDNVYMFELYSLHGTVSP